MSDIRRKNLKDVSQFNEIPIGWGEVTIEEICDLGRGRVISQDEVKNNLGAYPVYSSQTQNNGQMGMIDTYDFDGEYVTWTTDGENAGTVFYRIGKFNCTNVCGTLKAKSENVNLKFLSYQLGQVAKRYVSYIGNPKLMNGVMGKVGLILPTVEQQKKIAKILSTVDDLITRTQSLIDKYTSIKQGMMADLFSRGIDTATGQLRPGFEEAPELYKETELGWVPKGWEVQPLEKLLVNVSTPMRSGPFGSALLKHELVEEGIPLLGIDNIFVEHFENNFRRFVTSQKFNELSRYAVRPKDVVITIMGTVGRCCVLPENIGAALSSKHLWTMTFDQEKVIPDLICWQLNYAPWVKAALHRESQGAVMDAIQSKALRTLLLPVPPMAEQEKINAIYSTVNTKQSAQRQYKQKLEVQKKGLMQDLLTGKVPVPV
ncbi:restriction endonuclease subunit S [Endozoicomonas euniceicola]|uniref:Restriction endonuclease subunit S n=1 Tax=Endozoicomonas euniceicola TaxID=1234143 RepID=A0ABY6GWF2_9GAMM|nr:restriction endonuclease subunit S [Endozoicomonas euniceicola]UYM17093.1 restriction endonuclease subunit S [Endozoicomonas euniceicola]